MKQSESHPSGLSEMLTGEVTAHERGSRKAIRSEVISQITTEMVAVMKDKLSDSRADTAKNK